MSRRSRRGRRSQPQDSSPAVLLPDSGRNPKRRRPRTRRSRPGASMTRRRRWTLQALCILILLYAVIQLWGSYT